MPTARELLEQADALMRRRNLPPDPATPPVFDAPQAAHGPATDARFAVTDAAAPAEVPELPPAQLPPLTHAEAPGMPSGAASATPSATAALSAMRWTATAPTPALDMTSPMFVPPVSPSPRTIQREPIAPSVARTALPVEPAESPMVAPSTMEALPAAYAADPDFPVLTDAVPIDELARLEVAEDLPVLTEAVDAGADEPILEDLDEPSVWSPTFGAAPTVARPAPSAVAPGVGEEPPTPAGSRDPLGLDRPPPGFEPPSTAQWKAADDAAEFPGEAIAAEAPSAEALPAASGDTTIAVVSDQPALLGLSEAERADEPAEPSAETGEPAWADVAPAAIVAMAAELPAALPESGTAAGEGATSPTGDEPDEGPVAAPTDARAGETSVALPPPGTTTPDDARVREIAEEIGMQVLQRIDIFTDTELRARLGERLKPVVDRVSAELVAAINQHVGELLRVYVAEAIEREIERWRDRQT